MEPKAAVTPSTEELWKTYGDRLRRYIRKRVRHEADADDGLQEVFRRIHTSLDTLLAPKRQEAWVFQIARRAAIDHLRARFPVSVSVEPAATPAARDVSSEIASWLPSIVNSLPAPEREILNLVDLEGTSQQTAADRLGLSLTGAKSRVQRARKHLQEALLDCCDIETDARGNAIEYTPRRCACNGA
jgi:RNA polymerase sigma-70 factor (ECF subfamily)